MKLKPIAAAMALLVSGSAFAAYMPVQHAKAEQLQAKLDRNHNAYFAEADWFKRICISGLVQVNAMASTTNQAGARFGRGFADNSASDLWLSRANLYVDAAVNSWTEVHIAYDLANWGSATHLLRVDDERNYVGLGTPNTLWAPDEAYITIGDFAKSQFFLRAGREYVRFGDYQRNVTPATFTQLLTQTQADAVDAGFIDISGFNGDIYVFRSGVRAGTGSTHINNFGLQLGYTWENGDVTADFTADWMYDISAVAYLGAPAGVGLVTPANSARVGGLSFTAKVNYNQFDFMAQYASADSSFNAANLAVGGGNNSAFPVAWMIGAGYRFGIMNNDDSHVGLNFQMSHDGLAVLLPEYRVQGNFTIEPWKNTEVGLTLYWDKDYGTGSVARINGPANAQFTGTGRDVFTGLLSLTAKFA